MCLKAKKVLRLTTRLKNDNKAVFLNFHAFNFFFSGHEAIMSPINCSAFVSGSSWWFYSVLIT